jgi:hypothetical protein
MNGRKKGIRNFVFPHPPRGNRKEFYKSYQRIYCSLCHIIRLFEDKKKYIFSKSCNEEAFFRKNFLFGNKVEIYKFGSSKKKFKSSILAKRFVVALPHPFQIGVTGLLSNVILYFNHQVGEQQPEKQCR